MTMVSAERRFLRLVGNFAVRLVPYCSHGFVAPCNFRPRTTTILSTLESASFSSVSSRTFSLHASSSSSNQQRNEDDGVDDDVDDDDALRSWTSCITSNPSRSLAFSGIMACCGAALGPFLDSFHSAFGVLRYEEPITAVLWGSEKSPGLITAWWVPELFGLAGFLIGWLYVILDSVLLSTTVAAKDGEQRPPSSRPSPPLILLGISVFTFQYWLSGALYATGVDRTVILTVMTGAATLGFVTLDGTVAGFCTSLATAVGGPLIEVGLLSTLSHHGGYHYVDKGETGFFPLWIVPVYFLGGPAVGNLARGFWNLLSSSSDAQQQQQQQQQVPRSKQSSPCPVCNDSRAAPCPNCDVQGYYVTYGKEVKCNCCKGWGRVICRNCFDRYDTDANDIGAIRDIMARMPD